LSAHNLGQAAAAAATDITLEPLKQELVGTRNQPLLHFLVG
jgi:hypothetical protein